MADLFQVDLKELKQLIQFQKKAPRKFNKAAAFMLNDFAFMTKKEIPITIQKEMTVRNERFVRSKIRVKKTKITTINNLKSIVGSIFSPRFTGWIEQETGRRSEKKRVITLAGRKGSWKNKASAAARLKPGKTFLTPRKLVKGAKNNRQRTIIFLQMMNRKSSLKRKPFFLGSKDLIGRLQKGVYQFKGNKIKRLQTIKDTAQKPKRIPWMRTSRNNFIRNANIRQLWAKNISRVLGIRR